MRADSAGSSPQQRGIQNKISSPRFGVLYWSANLFDRRQVQSLDNKFCMFLVCLICPTLFFYSDCSVHDIYVFLLVLIWSRRLDLMENLFSNCFRNHSKSFFVTSGKESISMDQDLYFSLRMMKHADIVFAHSAAHLLHYLSGFLLEVCCCTYFHRGSFLKGPQDPLSRLRFLNLL